LDESVARSHASVVRALLDDLAVHVDSSLGSTAPSEVLQHALAAGAAHGCAALGLIEQLIDRMGERE
jgi:hypothetical protein